MPQNIRIALFLMGELLSALHANDPDTFKCWRSGGSARPREANGGGTKCSWTNLARFSRGGECQFAGTGTWSEPFVSH
ncbi:hypothetical protein N8654_04550 [Synechococcus sp. AH-601-B19]|nr:hypothetical protein [Synechococcus sp. AH-601-B19]